MIGRLRVQASGATAFVLWALLASPAAASCAVPPPIEAHLAMANAVFVGTVQQVTNEGRTASVEVHEIWRGPDLPARVIVHGGPEDPETLTSADRYFEAGTRYLFAASAHDGRLEDNGCTATQQWTEQLAELRSEQPRLPAPTPDAEAAGEVPTPLIVALVGAAVVALTGLLAFRRRA